MDYDARTVRSRLAFLRRDDVTHATLEALDAYSRALNQDVDTVRGTYYAVARQRVTHLRPTRQTDLPLVLPVFAEAADALWHIEVRDVAQAHELTLVTLQIEDLTILDLSRPSAVLPAVTVQALTRSDPRVASALIAMASAGGIGGVFAPSDVRPHGKTLVLFLTALREMSIVAETPLDDVASGSAAEINTGEPPNEVR